MIISRTPFRVSFIGGGTDLPSFYEKQQGAVISTAIDKYVYITVNKRFDSDIRVSYSKTEIAKNVNGIEHPLFREAMIRTGIWSGIEMTSVADIPSGTGLGSSSSFAVGALNALLTYNRFEGTKEQLAQSACDLEMNTLGEPIGKQDQFCAVYGGLRKYTFNPDGSVGQEQALCSPERRTTFFSHLMLFYLGGTRSASQVLRQAETSHLTALRALVDDFWDILTGTESLWPLGAILHQGWEIKKRMGNVTNNVIDAAYARARYAGALGGKLLGAGQAGFLLLFVPPGYQQDVREMLKEFREVPFEYESRGSEIIYEG